MLAQKSVQMLSGDEEERSDVECTTLAKFERMEQFQKKIKRKRENKTKIWSTCEKHSLKICRGKYFEIGKFDRKGGLSHHPDSRRELKL